MLTFCAKLKARVFGGEVSADGEVLQIRNADEACFYLAAATSYEGYEDTSGDPQVKCDAVLAPLSKKAFEAVRRRHCQDHRQLYRRVSFDLGATETSALPTDERIARFAEGEDPQLAALFFQYGRYLLIACSRPGCQPANLQGLWNEDLSPPWESKYTTNINTEMNYWPAEVCNLGECHEALFDALDEVVESDGGRPRSTTTRAAGCSTTISIYGGARRRSIMQTTASGPSAARGCASISGGITSISQT